MCLLRKVRNMKRSRALSLSKNQIVDVVSAESAFGALPDEIIQILIDDPQTFILLYQTSQAFRNRLALHEKAFPNIWTNLYVNRFGRKPDWIQSRINLMQDAEKGRVEKNVYLMTHISEAIFPVDFEVVIFSLPKNRGFDPKFSLRTVYYNEDINQTFIDNVQTDPIDVKETALYLQLSVRNKWFWGPTDSLSESKYEKCWSIPATWYLIFPISIETGELSTDIGYYVIGEDYREWQFQYSNVKKEFKLEFSAFEMKIKSIQLPSFSTLSNVFWSLVLERSLRVNPDVGISANNPQMFNYYNDIFTGKLWAFITWLEEKNVSKEKKRTLNPTLVNELDNAIAKDYTDKMCNLLTQVESQSTRDYLGNDLLEKSLCILFPFLVTLDRVHHRMFFDKFLPQLATTLEMEENESEFYNSVPFGNFMFNIFKRDTNAIIPKIKLGQLSVSCSVCDRENVTMACPHCKDSLFCSESCYSSGIHLC